MIGLQLQPLNFTSKRWKFQARVHLVYCCTPLDNWQCLPFYLQARLLRHLITCLASWDPNLFSFWGSFILKQILEKKAPCPLAMRFVLRLKLCLCSGSNWGSIWATLALEATLSYPSSLIKSVDSSPVFCGLSKLKLASSFPNISKIVSSISLNTSLKIKSSLASAVPWYWWAISSD